MAYSNDMTWAQWAAQATGLVNSLESNLNAGKDLQRKFAAMIYGLTDTQILALHAFAGRTQADLDSIRSCLNTLKTVCDVVYGAAPAAQYDYSGYFLPFEG